MVKPAAQPPSAGSFSESTVDSEKHLALFGPAILLGAFLLFVVQPIVARFILPWFGGSPAVWTTCMLFFQSGLLAGYAYAHFSVRRLSPRWQAFAHIGLLIAALAVLPIAPSGAWKPSADTEPAGRILLLLLVCVGLPYFALSATGPLLQAWYSRVNDGAAPYRLFGVSNAGSLLALLSYPVVVEPALSRQGQTTAWSVGLALFAVLCSCCAWTAARGATAPAGTARGRAENPARAPALWVWLGWVGLPGAASLLLLAVTNAICQDVAVVPFLWILPLSLYLLSFMVCFQRPAWYNRWVSITALALAVGGLCWNGYQVAKLPLVIQLGSYAVAVFSGCMLCHGELVRLQPDPAHLTAYYLMIALGGALGGAFVALAAPLLFSQYYELQLGLCLCLLISIVLIFVDWRRVRRGGWANAGRAGLLLVLTVLLLAVPAPAISARTRLVEATRSFFGVIRVLRVQPGTPVEFLIMMHGATSHGMQFSDPERRRWHTSYYGERTGLGVTMRLTTRSGGRRVGVVGLGTGTLASYGRPGDYFCFYEIDPEVERLARKHFTYLRDTEARWEVLFGDARLTLERQEPREYDVLVLDAFAGDAIPVHLLTREAFQVYQRHVKPDGVIAVHISNQHFDLLPVVWRQSRELGMKTLPVETPADLDNGVLPCDWVLLTRNEDFLKRGGGRTAAAQIEAMDTAAGQFPLWTDDRLDLLQRLK